MESTSPRNPNTPGVSFFTGASNIHISGNNTFQVTSDALQDAAIPDPILFLLRYCASDALVDSKERYDAPRCAPETRNAIHQEIIDWVKGGHTSAAIYWLCGSAGAGKSVICQTIAELFKKEGLLLGNFFFSRDAGSTGRSNGDRLLPTLIYQLHRVLPETRSYIEGVISQNRLILTSTRGTQMSDLYVAALNQSSVKNLFRRFNWGKKVHLVVLDGLDECQDHEVQCDLLRLIAESTKTLRVPVRFLIASRPESHIKRTILRDPSFRNVCLHSMDLDEDQDARQSILHFLRTEFHRIHETHPLRQYLDPAWPSEPVIQLLTLKSSPQFIYAATVIKYVGDPNADDRPDTRLDAILAIRDSQQNDLEDGDQPLRAIDNLYNFIFAGVKAKYRDLVWCILGILHLASHKKYEVPTPSPRFLEAIFTLPGGTVELMLRSLASVIDVPAHRNHPIRSLHASLFDYLLDRRRSGGHFVKLQRAHLILFHFHFNKRKNLGESYSAYFYPSGSRHLKGVLGLEGSLVVVEELLTFLDTQRDEGLKHDLQNILIVGKAYRWFSMADITYKSLLDDRFALQQERILNNEVTKVAPNPFETISGRIIHFICVGVIADIVASSPAPYYTGEQTLRQYFAEIIEGNEPFLNAPEDQRHQKGQMLLHFLAAMVALETIPEVFKVIQAQRAEICHLGCRLLNWTENMSDHRDLISGCRALVLACFDKSKVPPDPVLDVFEMWQHK